MAKEDVIEQPRQIPRYRLTAKAYIYDVLYEEGQEIDFAGVPGWHMEPLNESAKAAVNKHKPRAYNIVDEMTKITGGGGNGP